MARRLTFERQVPGDHFVKHDADTPDVCARVHLFAARLFARHVIDRAHYDARARLHAPGDFALGDLIERSRALSDFCSSQVQHLYATTWSDHDVGRLNFTMLN